MIETLEQWKNQVAIDKGYESWQELKLANIHNLENCLEEAAERYANQFKEKAQKWDDLDDEIGSLYDGEEDDEDSMGLITIGEIAATAFGYL